MSSLSFRTQPPQSGGPFWDVVAIVGYLVVCYAGVFARYLGCAFSDVPFTDSLCQIVCSPENQIYLLAAKQAF